MASLVPFLPTLTAIAISFLTTTLVCQEHYLPDCVCEDHLLLHSRPTAASIFGDHKVFNGGCSYPTLPNKYLLYLPIKQLAHVDGALVVLWITNREKLHVFVDEGLFPAWGVANISQNVSSENSQTHETLQTNKVIVSIPGAHSRKPPLGSFDHDGDEVVDLEQFRAQMKKMMLVAAKGLGLLLVQVVVEEGSFLKRALKRERAMKLNA